MSQVVRVSCPSNCESRQNHEIILYRCRVQDKGDRINEQPSTNCRAIARIGAVLNSRFSGSFSILRSLQFPLPPSAPPFPLPANVRERFVTSWFSASLFSFFFYPAAPFTPHGPPHCPAFYAVLTAVFLSGRLLYIVITIFILPLTLPFIPPIGIH